MKVLVTGVTREHSGSLKFRPTDKLDVPKGIAAAYRTIADEVEHRPVQFGENLSEFDFIWFSIGPANSRTGAWAPNALWGIYEAIRRGVAFAVFFDDWQFTTMLGGFQRFAEAGAPELERITTKLGPYKEDDEVVLRHTREILTVCQWFGEENSLLWQQAIPVMPGYAGIVQPAIVEEKFPPGLNFTSIDPSALLTTIGKEVPINHGGFYATEKDRRWIVATLVAHESWVKKLKLEWPVDVFGPRKLKAPRLKSEQEVFDQYVQHWGVLAPRYSISAGSGWFRARYYLAAKAGSVLLCGEEDAQSLGPAYQFNAREIESMSLVELCELARRQRARMREVANDNFDDFSLKLYDIALQAQEKVGVRSSL